MKIHVFKNADAQAPYVMSLDLSEEIIPPDTHFNVPIYVDHRSGRSKVFNVEMCGFRLEADAPEALIEPSQRLIAGLINMARLPDYVFVAGDSLLVYPVYTVDDEVLATTPGGPVFRHVELAKVRGFLSEYLHTMHVLGAVDHVETLHVRGVDRDSLGLVRPRFYLKKRVPGENDFWAPVFLMADGNTLYTYAANARRSVFNRAGLAPLALHAKVARALMDDNRLHDPFDLRPDRLFPEDWAALEKHLTPQPYAIRLKLETQEISLPVYRHGKIYVTAELRMPEQRYNIFLGRNPFDLRNRVITNLTHRGMVHQPDAVMLLAA